MTLSPSTGIGSILIEYADGVRTLVITNDYNPDYVVEQIKETISYVDPEDPESVADSSRMIDQVLQEDLDICQKMLHKEDIIIADKIIESPYPYTMGENEEVEDVQKFYPEYSDESFNSEDLDD